MNKIFAYEGWYYRTFSFVTNILLINFLFLLSCCTVIFSGAGFIALYRTSFALYEEKELAVFSTFIQEFRKNILRGLALTFFLAGCGTTVGIVLVSLFRLSVSFGFLAVVLFSGATLFINVCLILYSMFTWDLRSTIKESFCVVLSSSANAIVLLVIPVGVLVLLNQINLFFYLSLGIGSSAYLQVVFFQKVLGGVNG